MDMKNIIDELEKRGLQAEVKVVNKNGVLKTGIAIQSGKKIAPIIYVDGLLKEWDSLESVVYKILREYEKAKDTRLDVERIISKEYVFEHITIAVQRAGTEPLIKRESGLEGIEAYLIVMDNEMDDDGGISIKVTYDFLTESHISEAEAWKIAEKNLHKTASILGLGEIIAPVFFDKAEQKGTGGIDEMYIISNKYGIKGASAVLDCEIMENFAKMHHTKKIAILPSSIHEMILLPSAETLCEEELSNLVRQVNISEVRPEERLTDRAYFMEF